MKLLLIRHTQVKAAKGICYGQTDIELADSFSQEVVKLKNIIVNQQFSAVYSSPLSRCALLAQIISNGDIIYDARLKELNFGDWEGKSWSSIYNTEEGKIWFADYVNIPCPNGESFQDVITRVLLFINSLQHFSNNEVISIVTHAGTIRAFLVIIKSILPIEAFNIKIAYGQILSLDLPS